MRSVKIAHITTVSASLPHLCLSLLKDLQETGYEILAVSSPGPEAYALEKAGIRHIAIRMTRRITPLKDLLALWRLYRLLRREDISVVHTHTPKANLLGQLAARLAGVPVRVSTVHGLYFTSDTPAIKRTLFNIIETWSARFADAVFLVNREDLETVQRQKICVASKVHLLGCGIGADLKRFTPEAISKDVLGRIRARLGLNTKCKVIGFVGRLVAEKGLIELLQAAQELRKEFGEIRILIVGPEDAEKVDAVPPQITYQYGVEDISLFTGGRNDMPEMYGLMDVFVLPSHREGFPRAVMEALAMGLPCVVTDVRGCREVVVQGRTGFIVPPKDAQALASAIRWLLHHPHQARQIGEEGRRMAIQQFDERPAFERIKKEYARLLRQHGLPTPEPTPIRVLQTTS